VNSLSTPTGDEFDFRACVVANAPPIGELIWFHCAVAAAEELHFTRAASKLRMEQSAVSRHVQKLEYALGYRLFERDKRRVELSEAGKAFIPYARKCLAYARFGILRAQAIGRGEPSEFHVGYSPSVDVRLVVRAQALFESMAGRVGVNFRSMPGPHVVRSLLEGDLHAGLLTLPIERGLTTACLMREKLFVALPATHRLSRRQRISIAELAEEPVIWSAQEAHPAFREHLLGLFRKAGYIPNLSRDTLSVAETLGLVREGLGIAFVKTSDLRFLGKGLVFRPMTEASLVVETGIGYLGENKWDPLQRFVRSLASHFSGCAPAK